MNLRTEDARGWVGTIVFHLLVAVALFLWKLDTSVSEPEYIELSWASIAPVVTSQPARMSSPGSAGPLSPQSVSRSTPMDLPERRLKTDEEVLRLPPAAKIAADGQSSRVRTQLAENSRERKDRGFGAGLGKKAKSVAPGKGESTGEPASGAVGSGIGNNVSMSMQWTDGGTRKRLSGDLPEYPPGVKVETQIKIEVAVLPEGSVKSLRPVQKGNTALEEAAIRATRLWKFEPLRKSSPQREQSCVVTFNFQLR